MFLVMLLPNTIAMSNCVDFCSCLFIINDISSIWKQWSKLWIWNRNEVGIRFSRQIVLEIIINTKLRNFIQLFLIAVISIIGLNLSIMYGAIQASKIMHRKLLARVMRAPMSFFDTTPLGRVTNRFSTDMDRVDDLIPQYICSWMTMLAPVISLFVVISYSTPIFLVVTVPIIILFVITQVIILFSSLKRS